MATESDSTGEPSRGPDGSKGPAAPGIKRQVFWSMMPLLVVTVLNIFSVRLFVHYLGANLYALWFYVSTFTGAFGFIDLGLGVAVGRYIGVALGAGDQTAVREYWGTGNLVGIPLLLLMAAGFVVIGVVFGPRWFNVDAEHVPMLRWAFVCGGAGLFLSYYSQFWLVLSQAHLDFKFIGILRSGLNLLQLSLSIWLAYATKNPVILILTAAGVSLLQLSVFVWHARKQYRLGLNLQDACVARAREMSSYVFKSFGVLVSGCFLGSVDRLMLGKIAIPAAFSYYTIATNFGSRIQGLSQAVMGPVFHQTSRAVGRGSLNSAAHVYNEIFDFTFGWYALISIWMVCWHPVFLRLWLGQELAHQVAPAFVPLVIAYCLSAIASVSAAQLGPLNRMGADLVFIIVNGIVCGLGVWFGWQHGGLSGAARGFLLSRVVTLCQDVYVIRLIGGGGWLSGKTWIHLGWQCLVAALFVLSSRVFPENSLWLILPAGIHGGLVAAWLSRKYVGRFKTILSGQQ